MPREGWLERQRENTRKNIEGWPRWMKIESGVETNTMFVAYAMRNIPGLGLGFENKGMMAIVAFNAREAEEKIIEYCAQRDKVAGSFWSIWRLQQVEGADVMRARKVLRAAGVPVLEIVQEGKREFVRPAKPCPMEDA